MHTHSQIFFDYLTASRTEFACVARVNLYARSTSVFSFIVRELYKLIPRCVLNTFSQRMITNHAFDIQILKGDNSKHGNESRAKLMSKVAATISDAFVDAPCRFTLLASLRFSQRLFIRAKESWISNLLAIRECTERSKTNINAYRSIVRRKWLRLCLNREARIPFTSCRASDGESFNLAFNRAVHSDSHVPNLGQSQLTVCKSKAGLSVGEGIVSLARAETGKACFLFSLFNSAKEVLKSLIESAENILQDLAVNLVKFWTGFFDFRQLILLVNITNSLALALVRISSLLQACIVEFAQQSKRSIHARYLCVRRNDAITKCPLHLRNFLLKLSTPAPSLRLAMARSAKSTPIVNIKAEFRVFGKRLDVVSMKYHFTSARLRPSTFHATEYACPIITAIDSHAPRPIFRRCANLPVKRSNAPFPACVVFACCGGTPFDVAKFPLLTCRSGWLPLHPLTLVFILLRRAGKHSSFAEASSRNVKPLEQQTNACSAHIKYACNLVERQSALVCCYNFLLKTFELVGVFLDGYNRSSHFRPLRQVELWIGLGRLLQQLFQAVVIIADFCRVVLIGFELCYIFISHAACASIAKVLTRGHKSLPTAFDLALYFSTNHSYQHKILPSAERLRLRIHPLLKRQGTSPKFG